MLQRGGSKAGFYFNDELLMYPEAQASPKRRHVAYDSHELKSTIVIQSLDDPKAHTQATKSFSKVPWTDTVVPVS